jgi:hypothetical protein
MEAWSSQRNLLRYVKGRHRRAAYINRTRRFMLIDLCYSRRSVKESMAASIADCAYIRQTLIFRNRSNCSRSRGDDF